MIRIIFTLSFLSFLMVGYSQQTKTIDVSEKFDRLQNTPQIFSGPKSSTLLINAFSDELFYYNTNLELNWSTKIEETSRLTYTIENVLFNEAEHKILVFGYRRDQVKPGSSSFKDQLVVMELDMESGKILNEKVHGKGIATHTKYFPSENMKAMLMMGFQKEEKLIEKNYFLDNTQIESIENTNKLVQRFDLQMSTRGKESAFNISDKGAISMLLRPSLDSIKILTTSNSQLSTVGGLGLFTNRKGVVYSDQKIITHGNQVSSLNNYCNRKFSNLIIHSACFDLNNGKKKFEVNYEFTPENIESLYANIPAASNFNSITKLPKKLGYFEVYDCFEDGSGNVISMLSKEDYYTGDGADHYKAKELIFISQTISGDVNWICVVPREFSKSYSKYFRNHFVKNNKIHVVVIEAVNPRQSRPIYRTIDLKSGQLSAAQFPEEDTKYLIDVPVAVHKDGSFSHIGMREGDYILEKFYPE